MTPEEWQLSEDAEAMLAHLGQRRVASRIDHRAPKMRLFAANCSNLLGNFVPARCRNAAAVAERFAFQKAKRRELRRAFEETADMVQGEGDEDDFVPRLSRVARMSVMPEINLNGISTYMDWAYGTAALKNPKLLPQILRDIFGPDPGNPAVTAINPQWLTTDVICLAEGIHRERAYDRMPILADALEDAGCDSQFILDHCRNGKFHVRGNWVIAAILGQFVSREVAAVKV